MGTTLDLAVISDNFIRTYNIGDSRIYKFQDKILPIIYITSEDNTIAQQKIRLLLCSDGLTDILPDSQIQNLMLEKKDTSSCC